MASHPPKAAESRRLDSRRSADKNTSCTRSSTSHRGTRASRIPCTIAGDADCNETVNAVDGLKVLRFVAGLDSAGCLGATDVDCSGAVDSVDALDILRYVAGLQQTGLPENC